AAAPLWLKCSNRAAMISTWNACAAATTWRCGAGLPSAAPPATTTPTWRARPPWNARSTRGASARSTPAMSSRAFAPFAPWRSKGDAMPSRDWRLTLAAWRFRVLRADYYDYLADLMEGARGRKPLRDIFQDDARRYGPSTARGALCTHWLRAYEESGGDLFQAWHGTLPDED